VATSTAQVLVIDDDARHAASVRELLSAHGYRTDFIADADRHAGTVDTVRTDILIVALERSDAAGADVLRTLQRRNPALKAIIVSDTSSCDSVAPLLRLGVCDFLMKPYEPEQLVQSVRDALERSNAERARETSDRQRQAFLCALPDLVYLLDARGCFTFLGERLSDVFGFERESLLGRPWAELLDAALSESLRYRFDERRSGARATRGLDFEWHDPRGSLHVIELSGSAAPAGCCGT